MYDDVARNRTSLALDAGNGLGHPVSMHAMERTIDKGARSRRRFTTVRNSNHYGIAGYYAMMALEHDMIGISSTDSIHFAVPTFGRDKMQGTNPFAFAIPAGEEPAFVLDFATTTVTYGKLEVYERMGKKLLPGWAVDADGGADRRSRPKRAFAAHCCRSAATAPTSGGHKGYGLGVLSEILCGVLAGGLFGSDLSLVEGPEHRGGHTGHWFGALRIDALRDIAAFKADMDAELRTFNGSRPVARARSRDGRRRDRARTHESHTGATASRICQECGRISTRWPARSGSSARPQLGGVPGNDRAGVWICLIYW